MPDQQRYHNPDQDCVVEIGNGEKTVTLVCKTDEEFEMAYACATKIL